MLNVTKKPMIQITETTEPCFLPAVGDICDPCRQLDFYLPKIKAPTLKENSVIEALAKAFLQVDDELLKKICGFCLTWDTSDCQCLLAFGASIGVPTNYVTIDATNCMRFGYTEIINQCCIPDVPESPIIPEGFSAWIIPEADYAELGCNVSNVELTSIIDNLIGFAYGTGEALWSDSQASIDNFLQSLNGFYSQNIEGDLLIGSYNNRPILFLKNGSILNLNQLYFLLNCSDTIDGYYYKAFTQQFQQTTESDSLICKREVFAYCQQLCNVCNFHDLDVCNNPADFEFYKKIVKFKSTWFHKAPTRKNITDALVDWFGDEAHVVDARYPNIFWSLGRSPTEQELSIMPFVYSMMPIYDGLNMIFTEEL